MIGRRLLLSSLWPWKKKQPPPRAIVPPLDEEALNRFAAAYNNYVEAVNAGHIDVGLWLRVEYEWMRLGGHGGKPRISPGNDREQKTVRV